MRATILTRLSRFATKMRLPDEHLELTVNAHDAQSLAQAVPDPEHELLRVRIRILGGGKTADKGQAASGESHSSSRGRHDVLTKSQDDEYGLYDDEMNWDDLVPVASSSKLPHRIPAPATAAVAVDVDYSSLFEDIADDDIFLTSSQSAPVPVHYVSPSLSWYARVSGLTLVSLFQLKRPIEHSPTESDAPAASRRESIGLPSPTRTTLRRRYITA